MLVEELEVDPPGVAPGSLPCKDSIFLLDDRPKSKLESKFESEFVAVRQSMGRGNRTLISCFKGRRSPVDLSPVMMF